MFFYHQLVRKQICESKPIPIKGVWKVPQKPSSNEEYWMISIVCNKFLNFHLSLPHHTDLAYDFISEILLIIALTIWIV